MLCRARASRLSVACRLAEQERVGAIVNLQEDSDMAYFNLDLAPVRARCAERGDVAHVRHPIRDFDAFDLRMKLAGAGALRSLAWLCRRACMHAQLPSRHGHAGADGFAKGSSSRACCVVQALCSWWRIRSRRSGAPARRCTSTAQQVCSACILSCAACPHIRARHLSAGRIMAGALLHI